MLSLNLNLFTFNQNLFSLKLFYFKYNFGRSEMEIFLENLREYIGVKTMFSQTGIEKYI
jgi:hypothetical protein